MKAQKTWKVSPSVWLDETFSNLLSKRVKARRGGGRPGKSGNSPESQIFAKIKGCSIVISENWLQIFGEQEKVENVFGTIAWIIETKGKNVNFDLSKIILFHDKSPDDRLGARATKKVTETIYLKPESFSSYTKSTEGQLSSLAGFEVTKTRNGRSVDFETMESKEIDKHCLYEVL